MIKSLKHRIVYLLFVNAIKTYVLPTLILLCFLCGSCRAGRSATSIHSLQPDSLQAAMLDKALTSVYRDSFETALTCIDSLIIMHSGYWPAYVIKAGIVFTEMTDDEDYKKKDNFIALIDTSLAGLDKFLKRNPDDKWGLFFKGTALGYLAVWEGNHGSWYQAITKGLKAGKFFDDAYKQDSLFYDACLGLGNLHYWRSAKLGIIRNLPFISDRREQGIEELKLAIEKSRLSSTAAALGLSWIYIDRKEYRQAAALTDSLIKQGIDGRTVLWPNAIANFKRGDARRTIEKFTLIREGLIRKGGQNYYNLILAGYCLGVAHYWQRENGKALEYFNEILDYEVSKEVAKRVSKKLKKAQDYREKILNSRRIPNSSDCQNCRK
ncbi:MAG: hypothetical protein J7K40_13425 [candidate division Zixibacteria bacterium]|nr:hypothetical protein [candidate division Zixibacteria bacterium]